MLVVDDDPDVLELSCEWLREEVGCEVYAARHGGEALAVLRGLDAPPRLILLDWMMPVMSGPDLLIYLSEDQALSGIPVVVITASPRAAVPEGVRVFRKPVALDALLGLVREHCEPDAPAN